MAQTAQVEDKTEQQGDQVQAQAVELSEATGTKPTGAGASIDILLDVDVPIIATIGRTEVPIQQILQLCPGSVLKLNKSIDAPIELYLKDIKFANGSVVVVDGKFAVRIKEIFSSGGPMTAGKK